ncbi:MAG: glycosyltransferase family 8 protein [Devosia sp.]
MTSTPIHIALTFDDNFWAPAYATMRSVCLNTAHTALTFHLCHEGLTEAQIAQLSAIEAEFGASVRHYPLAENARFVALSDGLRLHKRFRRVIFARLLLDTILPPEVRRVLYLDSDTMATGDINLVWQSDLQGKSLGAVSDPMRLYNMFGRDLRQKRDVFALGAPYFNSGVLLIDLEKFAKADLPRQIAELKRSGVANTLDYDQDMLNYIFRGDWQQLDWRYNIVDPHMAHQAMEPVIVHYTLQARPWTLRAGLLRRIAYARLYRHVMTNAVFYAFLRQRWARYWLTRLGARR